MSLSVRTLLPMAADGIGPSYTCSRLVAGASRAGHDIDLMVNRSRMAARDLPIHTVLPGPLTRLPYKWVQGPASQALEAWYLSRLKGGDVAWLWPSVSLQTHEKLYTRNVPIVLEGINTRMKSARDVLDAAYDAFGAAPAHGITQDRIDEEETKLAMATTIFAPSPSVEAALQGSPLDGRVIASSYGVDTGQALKPQPDRTGENKVRFLFVGYACVRKGVHHLLELWRDMPATAVLRLVGRIEPLIAERYADLLASDRVETVGFTRDVPAHYAASDVFVFPSLEEGDPLVTYEAALNGLPIIASLPGAGRMGAERGIARIIEPTDRDAFLQALLEAHDSAEQRAEWGAKARAAVADYDWADVGARRMEQLQGKLLSTPLPQPDRSTQMAPATVAARDVPAVTVVLPAFNRAGSIRQAVDSVLRQTWTDFELVVVDDGSSDGTPDIVRKMDDPRIRLFEQPENTGPSGARNRGVREARGDWVAFQDSDDEWLPEKLSLQMARLMEPDADWIAAYCGMAIVGHVVARAGRTSVRYIPDPSVRAVEGDIQHSLLRASLVSTQMLVARREHLLAIGGFDEELKALEDWDLALRLSARGPFAFVDEPLVLQRFSFNSITRDQVRRTIARTQIIEKHAELLAREPELLAMQYRSLAGEYRLMGDFASASMAMSRAREAQPGNPALWLRSAYLAFGGARARRR